MSDSPVPDLSTVTSPPRQSLTYEDLRLSEEPLGAGGQAVVYEATLTGSDKPSKVALKEPQHEGTLTTEAGEAFLQEAETWRTIDRREREKPRWMDYEHIVGVIDTGERPLPWIAMEYMDGGSLAERLDNTPDGLAVDQALWIGECLCRGLEIADEYGFSHLDVKPKNVLFRQTPDGMWDVPKLADWGVARTLANETGTMEAKTVAYSAPEQFEPSEYGDPDSLTDLYQVGAVVYTMVTGEPPYTGSPTQIMREVVLGDGPIPPSHTRSKLSEAIDVAVTTAMAKHKSDRYRGLERFEQALRAIRTGGRLPPVIANQIDSASLGDRSRHSVENSGTRSRTPEENKNTSDNSASTDSWPQFQGNAARTGYHPEISAPSPPVTKDWQFETGHKICSSPTVADGTVFVGGEDGKLYAVDASTGEEVWHFNTGRIVGDSPAVANNTVFVGSRNNNLYALDVSTGRKFWRFETGDWIRWSPAVADGTVFVGSYDQNLYAVDARSGEAVWNFETGDEIRSSPAVADGTVFIASDDNILYSVDISSGEENWGFQTQYGVSESPTVADGTLFVEENYRNLYALDANSGEKVWQFDIEDWFHSSPAVADGTVFVTSDNHNLYAVNKSSGEEVWHFETGDQIQSSPAVADGTVFMRSNDGNLYAVDASSGEEVWHLKLGDKIWSSPAIANGQVFITNDDGNLCAISEE
jgi:outer membrane protein assembly factor BamB